MKLHDLFAMGLETATVRCEVVKGVCKYFVYADCQQIEYDYIGSGPNEEEAIREAALWYLGSMMEDRQHLERQLEEIKEAYNKAEQAMNRGLSDS